MGRSEQRRERPNYVEVSPGASRPRFLTWPYADGYIQVMKSIAAGKFKDVCLKTLDDVARTKSPVVVTKRGRPVATLVPYVKSATRVSLVGSILKEVGDSFGTGEHWDADPS